MERVYTAGEISALVKDLINAATGPVHYYVAHNAYPEGAGRENAKFIARKSPLFELMTAGITFGQWVGAARIDATAAYARDGATVAGLVVDGVPWPDLRLLMLACEERTRNSAAIARHPEVADWSDAQYLNSAYRRQAELSQAALQDLLDTQGIDYIELNPHRDSTGGYDGRVDALGRYVGLAFGAGQCLNAAMVELGAAAVHLHAEGRFLVPELALKDFYSYAGIHEDSIETSGVTVGAMDVSTGLLESLAALAYMADGYVFSVDLQSGVGFRRPARADHVIYFDPLRMGVQAGATDDALANTVLFEANPLSGAFEATYRREDSADYYGERVLELANYSVSTPADAEKLVEGLLDDLAYPEPEIVVTLFQGTAAIAVGDLVEVRGAPVRQLGPVLPGAWEGRFPDQITGRVREIRHRLTGREVTTVLTLTSPIRSVRNPAAFMVRSQESPAQLFAFRLDAATVGLDVGFHLD